MATSTVELLDLVATLPIPEGKTGVMAYMSQEGDTKHMWNKDNPDEVEAARTLFNTLTQEKRYAAYAVRGKEGERGTRVYDFNPNAERLIFAPGMVGG